MAGLSLLADACALIVFHGYAGQTMSEAGKMAMGAGDIFVSPITVWEISRKVALGKLERPTPAGFGGDREAGYRVLPMTWDGCERANRLPMLHKDPMDRILIAAALARDLTVVTDDQIFARYGVATVW